MEAILIPLPTPLQKVTWFFGLGKYGWSQTWYIQKTASPPNSPAFLALNVARPLGPLFANIMAGAAAVVGIRAVDMLTLGASAVDDTVYPGTQAPLGAGEVDVPAVGALYRGRDLTNVYHRQVWFHGLPATWGALTEPNSVSIEDPLQAANVATWQQAMVAAGFGMLVINRDPAVNVAKPILGFGASVIPGYTTVAVVGNTFVEGDSVRIRGVKYSNPQLLPRSWKPNGIFTVTNPAAAGFDIPIAFPTLPPQCVYTGAGVVWKRSYLFAQFAGVDWEGYATRRTGRAFFVPRGRRRRPR